ncbi:MAG: hypothetical protein J6Y78_04445 [Paludibacteraceae bacterium]|nr:hypothetical protein [Paludibacteraceae bacterium]
MTEKRFIQGGDSYSSRYLHSDEKFRKERNWNINLPIEREFKSGECIVTDKDDTAYHIDELVTLLNELHNENEQLKKALRELLEEYGNSYYIDLFDKLFNLEYREWYNPTAPNNEPYVDWEKIAKEKELSE